MTANAREGDSELCLVSEPVKRTMARRACVQRDSATKGVSVSTGLTFCEPCSIQGAMIFRLLVMDDDPWMRMDESLRPTI